MRVKLPLTSMRD